MLTLLVKTRGLSPIGLSAEEEEEMLGSHFVCLLCRGNYSSCAPVNSGQARTLVGPILLFELLVCSFGFFLACFAKSRRLDVFFPWQHFEDIWH